MRVFFSYDYNGGNAYLGMKKQPMMMDTQVADVNNLLDFMELRLGLHTVIPSDAERLVNYYKCVRDYMNEHKDDDDNQLYASYTVSPLATSREMLKWRDALAVCGWDKDTPASSRRLKVLQGVEQLFSKKGFADVGCRLRTIIDRLKQLKEDIMKDVTFVLPFDQNLLDPTLKEIFSLAVEHGAQIEQLYITQTTENNNLAKLKHLLTAETAESLTLDRNDDSVRIWRFKDGMEAEEYLAALGDDAWDVIIQPDTKLMDNYLHMMGKPVAGSSVANSAPQIIQMFFTGVAMMAKPLNIGVLLQWLYAPNHPLPSALRYRLARLLAKTGGWLPETIEDGADNCFQLVQKWINGEIDAEGQPISAKERKSRQCDATVFLPDFEGGNEDTMTVQKLHTFLTELSKWSKEYCAIVAQQDEDDLRIAQFHRLSELCEILKSLTDDLEPTAIIPYSDIEKYMACLYEPSEFIQYRAQAKSRFTVATPGQVAADADRVLWAGLHDFVPMSPDTAFLTPTEQSALKEHITLWDNDDVRRIQQQTLLLPLLFCQEQLTLVIVEDTGSESLNKHPLIVRIEQQVRNYGEIAITPRLESIAARVPVPALANNAICGSDGRYTRIERTDLIKWREHESPTTIERLMQDPIDYTLENIAYIDDNGQSELSDISRTKGNVAHAVIQHLFYVPGDLQSGYPGAIKKRVEDNYKVVFDKVVETKGAILLLQENAIERRQLFGQLKECIDHLIDIINQDHLHVVACELNLEGITYGTREKDVLPLHGSADMVLESETGQSIIFDFKWTTSRKKYETLLQKNRSSQLAIYAELLSASLGGKPVKTAYFLMPLGKLYSTVKFKSYWTEKIEVEADCQGDIISKIVNSYHYRRKEIMSGKIEMGEGLPLEYLDYFNDMESKKLFPLRPDYEDDRIKYINGYSNYSHLKN